MKRRIRQIVIVMLAVVVLTASGFVQSPVRAHGIASYIVIFPPVGLAPGQSLRLTLFNPDGLPLRAQARLHHTGGVVVGLGDGSVREGTFHSFDFKRSEIRLPGEEGTGRLQLSASITWVGSASPREIDRVVSAMELIDTGDGSSNTIFFSERYGVVPGNVRGEDVVGIDFRPALMGVARGQTLRVTLFNPRSSGHYLPSRLKLFDAAGRSIAQSSDVVVPPGAFRSFDFRRNDILLAGEEGTGRLQLRVHLQPATDNPLIPLHRQGGLLVSFELIEDSTGRTTAQFQNNLKQIGLGSY